MIALWVEMDPDGPTFERESAWTEWVRRVSAKELARRMAGRMAGTEVREIRVTRRSPTGRAIECAQDDLAEAVSSVRTAAGRRDAEMLFTFESYGREGTVSCPRRGWGKAVGMCQTEPSEA